jgi:hypothetical protein
VGNAHFLDDTQHVFSSLHTWGWITIIVGIIQLTGGFSLFGGGRYGRIVGIFAAGLCALESLLSIGGTHPMLVAGHLRAVHLHPARPHSSTARKSRPEPSRR